MAAGRGGWDHSSLVTLIEDWAGYRPDQHEQSS
jgi:hypothetical protein